MVVSEGILEVVAEVQADGRVTGGFAIREDVALWLAWLAAAFLCDMHRGPLGLDRGMG